MSLSTIALRDIVLIAAIFLMTNPLLAQQPKAAPAPANQAKGAAAPSAAPTKTQILASPAWKQINDEYQTWLSSQAIYTPADIQRINAKLAAQIQALPADEMQGFVDDWLAKLKVLNGKNFQDAQQWLGTYLSVLTDGYRRQTLKQLGLTDVANMSAAQLDEAITQIRAQQFSTQQSQAAYHQSQQQVASVIQQNNAATQQAGSPGASSFGTTQAPGRAPKFNPASNPQLPMYVDGYGRIGFGLPF
jgi:hypothetical protein